MYRRLSEMGKYMRKAKAARDLSVMDLTHGVRTRAKTLALKKQQGMKLLASSASPPSSTAGYLQLRSRRLEKKPSPISPLHHDPSRRQQQRQDGTNNGKLGQQQQKKQQEKEEEGESGNPSPSPSTNLKPSSLVGKDSGSGQEKEVGESKDVEENNNSNGKDLGSFGDNVLDIEGRDRSTRESTPCNLTIGTEDTRTPGSTTKHASPTESSRRLQNSMRRHIPTAHEMDEFFGLAEEEQRRQFITKYNFDPVNEKPLPGRFEWEKMVQ